MGFDFVDKTIQMLLCIIAWVTKCITPIGTHKDTKGLQIGYGATGLLNRLLPLHTAINVDLSASIGISRNRDVVERPIINPDGGPEVQGVRSILEGKETDPSILRVQVGIIVGIADPAHTQDVFALITTRTCVTLLDHHTLWIRGLDPGAYGELHRPLQGGIRTERHVVVVSVETERLVHLAGRERNAVLQGAVAVADQIVGVFLPRPPVG